MTLTKATNQPQPVWTSPNDENHRRKHTHCFERLLGVTGREVTLAEYLTRAQAAINGSWAEFEAEHCREGWSAHFVDDDLVEAITPLDRSVFKTCFHQHFNCKANCGRLIADQPGNRRAKFIEQLGYDEKCELYRKVRRIRGV